MVTLEQWGIQRANLETGGAEGSVEAEDEEDEVDGVGVLAEVGLSKQVALLVLQRGRDSVVR